MKRFNYKNVAVLLTKNEVHDDLRRARDISGCVCAAVEIVELDLSAYFLGDI